MAKRKNITYLLIACVAAVWGLIIYRVYLGLNTEDTTSPQMIAPKVTYFKMVNHEEDMNTINLNYRDPFSTQTSYETLLQPKSALSEPYPASTLKPIMQKPAINWPQIQYTGYINNPDNKQKMILLNIGGSSALLKEGYESQGVKLVKNFGDSIKLKFQGETKMIKIR